MTAFRKTVVIASIAALGLGLAGCKNNAEKAADTQADVIRDSADATGDAIDQRAEQMGDATEDAMKNRADAIRASGEAKADAIEDAASNAKKAPSPTR